MVVLKEILTWSQERPPWQRDALRRLVETGDLSDEETRDLTEVCKSAHGLAEPREAHPLGDQHVSATAAASEGSALVSIFHHRGVNALAEDQTLKFGPHLTVVYGDNAAGKSGYIRILKSACRARGREKILGNVVSGAAPHAPVVAIKYRVGLEAQPREWAGQGEDDFISRISVFDTQCAAVYLKEKTDVAFRPFGLDLFDKLVRACKAIRLRLESEQRALGSSTLLTLQAQVPEGTSAARLLSSLSSLTNADKVHDLVTLSAEEEARLALLEKSLLDLQANDPEKLARQLTLRAGRVRTLGRHLRDVQKALSTEAVDTVFAARAEARRKAEEAGRLRAATFQEVLAGTGSEAWSALWQSARAFSQELAYPGQGFPVVEHGAQCVLCQQDLDHAASHRLKQFEAFVISVTEQELRNAREIFARQQSSFVDLKTVTETTDEAIDEIRVDQEGLADAVSSAVATNESRLKAVVCALCNDADLPHDCPALVSADVEVDALAEQLEQRAKTLREKSDEETKRRLTTETRELGARKLLGKHEQAILNEIERRKKVAAYGLCLDDTKTQAITQKSTSVTRSVVTQRLKGAFREELAKLDFRHVEVELREVGGTEGVLYHKLALTRAPGVELPKVVSEGEQRCLSIAAFFAELSTADDPSGIVFDDPVSSLDYKWREGVARKLVEAAKHRQVIIFTHDIVFLLLLKQFSQEQQVEQIDQHIRQLSTGAGVCANELPWVALTVRKKIGYLKNEWQTADKLFREGHQSAYEKDAKFVYGLLREAWERALEEVLLCGVVERYRPGVQTQQILKVADITEDDCRLLDTAMTKCSRWLPGHDQAAAARAEVPEPTILKADIEELEQWIDKIRKRRT